MVFLKDKIDINGTHIINADEYTIQDYESQINQIQLFNTLLTGVLLHNE